MFIHLFIPTEKYLAVFWHMLLLWCCCVIIKAISKIFWSSQYYPPPSTISHPHKAFFPPFFLQNIVNCCQIFLENIWKHKIFEVYHFERGLSPFVSVKYQAFQGEDMRFSQKWKCFASNVVKGCLKDIVSQSWDPVFPWISRGGDTWSSMTVPTAERWNGLKL